MAARPQIAVRSLDEGKQTAQAALPAVFLSPIRPDIVTFVHTNMNKNARQAYAVMDMAGMGHSAISWGTGRAVARIPRVSGGGNSRSGQGAFGNMCRKGRMFGPTKTWRKWHRKINVNQKRYAVASALAASALPALVMARGHSIENVPEVPLVLDNKAESLQRTKQAIAALKAVGAYDDVQRSKASRKLRAGKGKMRNRRHVQRRGPLVVYAKDNGIGQAFRNLPGVEVASVESLNLLQLAPGGHLGRFVVWTQGAFDRLNGIWGSQNRESDSKKGYKLPRPVMTNSDLTRIINSDEAQSRVNPTKQATKRAVRKRNPIKNLGARVKLNPYALALRRSELLTQERVAKQKAARLEAIRKGGVADRSAAAAAQTAQRKTHGAQKGVNFKKISVDDYVAKKVAVKKVAAKDCIKPKN